MSWSKERRKAHIISLYEKRDNFPTLGNVIANIKMPSDYTPGHVDETYMSLNSEGQVVPNLVIISGKLNDLGYGNIHPTKLARNEELLKRCCYIVDQQLHMPAAQYGYHGTSGAFHTSVQKNGLDSGQNIEVNPGAMVSRQGFCYSTSMSIPKDFAETTTDKVSSNKEGFTTEIKTKVPLFNEKNNTPVLYRFRLDKPHNYDEIGVQPPTSADKMDMSLDGETWYPADKFTLEKSPYGHITVVPDYNHKEILALDEALIWETRNLAQKASDSFLKKKAPATAPIPQLNTEVKEPLVSPELRGLSGKMEEKVKQKEEPLRKGEEVDLPDMPDIPRRKSSYNVTEMKQSMKQNLSDSGTQDLNNGLKEDLQKMKKQEGGPSTELNYKS